MSTSVLNCTNCSFNRHCTCRASTLKPSSTVSLSPSSTAASSFSRLAGGWRQNPGFLPSCWCPIIHVFKGKQFSPEARWIYMNFDQKILWLQCQGHVHTEPGRTYRGEVESGSTERFHLLPIANTRAPSPSPFGFHFKRRHTPRDRSCKHTSSTMITLRTRPRELILQFSRLESSHLPINHQLRHHQFTASNFASKSFRSRSASTHAANMLTKGLDHRCLQGTSNNRSHISDVQLKSVGTRWHMNVQIIEILNPKPWSWLRWIKRVHVELDAARSKFLRAKDGVYMDSTILCT